MHSFALSVWRKLRSLTGDLVFRTAFPGAGSILLLSLAVHAQPGEIKAVEVDPGAPRRATKVFRPSARAKRPPLSAKDVEFMQGMIMHHAQAVEMTELI